MKHAKFTKKKISPEDTKQIKAVYNTTAHYANGTYLTPILFDKSTLVRITYAEFNQALGENIPVCAVMMSIEDLQTNYNAMTQLLQNMRELGRIT